GDECCEELALADAPVGRAVHRQIERVGKGASEELGPVVKRLQDVGWFRASLSPDGIEDDCLLGIVAVLESSQPHGSTASPAFNRSRPAATATETVCSKMTSSEYPASFSAWMSRSVTLYALLHTLSRYAANSGGASRSGCAAWRSRSTSASYRVVGRVMTRSSPQYDERR